MTLSGSVDFDMNARQVIKAALRKLGRLGAGQVTDADIMENGREALNLMLKSWQKYDVLWLRKTANVTMVSADISGITQANPGVVTTSAAHNITTGDQMFISSVVGMTELNGQFIDAVSAAGSTVTLGTLDTSGYTAYTSGGKIRISKYNLSTNPRRVYSVRHRTHNATGPIDIPLTEMTYEEYYDLVNKGSQGRPNQYYFDPTLTEGHLYVWPVQDTVASTPQQIEYTYQSRFDDIDDLSNTLDITQESLEAVVYNLAERLIPDMGVSGERAGGIRQQAAILRQEMEDDSRDNLVQFVPDYKYGS